MPPKKRDSPGRVDPRTKRVQDSRTSETPEEREARLEDNRIRNAESRAAETTERRNARLEQNRLRVAESSATETHEQRETRTEENRLRTADSRAAETPDQHEVRSEANRLRTAASRAAETAEQYETRAETNRLRTAELRAAEAPERRATRLESDRLRNARSRQMLNRADLKMLAFNYNPSCDYRTHPKHAIGKMDVYFIGDEQLQADQRCENTEGTRRDIVLNLQRMLHQHNSLVNMFKTALDRMPSDEYKVVIRADKRPVGEHERRFNAPTVNEPAIVIVGNEFDKRDIIIQRRSNVLHRISETHRSYDALQYPLIFWEGEDGYHFNVMQTDPSTVANDGSVSDIGQLVMLPATFTGSPRHMHKYAQDASNPDWNEIKEELLAGQVPSDRHDLIARVFKQKLSKLMDMITKSQIYEETRCWMYSVEWQKRGLPHAHILIWLRDKIRPTQIDSAISAELPDPEQDPILFEIVTKNMIHGPCGPLNPNSPCMKERKCTKQYPREFLQETQTGNDGDGDQAKVDSPLL
ncbi:hypothetical protein ANCCEY_10689 [Ancylostoma ceylanicum]|uniref:Helitron helicase-like domain-containing protein n=1 Tax=Ancylostoma ceylanicum TaxID=53326 RepID=A0A0D6LE48_9BILA|nr:hypothetical protein ANCCEY_10689 [Ancylostoma ceylanicum]